MSAKCAAVSPKFDQVQTLSAASGQPTYFGKTVRRYGKLACTTKNQARLKEKSGISSRSLEGEKVCDRWRKRENATLKKNSKPSPSAWRSSHF
jgi:hypothetical protein